MGFGIFGIFLGFLGFFLDFFGFLGFFEILGFFGIFRDSQKSVHDFFQVIYPSDLFAFSGLIQVLVI